MITTIRIDDKRINRCRAFFISDQLAIPCGLFINIDQTFSPANIQHAFEMGDYNKVLPHDYFVNSIHRDPVRCGFVIMITSKEFDAVNEYDLVPIYTFNVIKNEDGIKVTGVTKLS